LWLNERHGWDGPVFRGRFRSQLVTDEAHLRYLLAYIHLNPVEALLVRRLTEEAWTSHRAYLGKDGERPWLSTAVFLDLFGGAAGLHEFVQSVRRGAVEYPADFNPDTGLFGKKAIQARDELRPARKAGRPPGKPATIKGWHRLRTADDVLAEVLVLTGARREDLLRSRRGPRANPARRFAIWALNRSSELSQREISTLLRVSFAQVVSLLGRLRHAEAPEPLSAWIRTWLAREAKC
jgi:hypothetical protein